MDFVESLQRSKMARNGIFTVSERLSKTIRTIPTKTKIYAFSTAMLVEGSIYRNHGISTNITCDKSTFMNSFWKSPFNILSTKISISSAINHRQAANIRKWTEKWKTMSRPFVSFEKSDCDKYLVDLEVAYDSSINLTTIFCSFFLNYAIHHIVFHLDMLSTDNSAAAQFLTNMK